MHEHTRHSILNSREFYSIMYITGLAIIIVGFCCSASQKEHNLYTLHNNYFCYVCLCCAGDIGYLSQRVCCGEGILFRHTPASYNYSWHNAPRRCKNYIYTTVTLNQPIRLQSTMFLCSIDTCGILIKIEDL